MRVYKVNDFKGMGIAADEVRTAERLVGHMIKAGATVYEREVADTVIADPADRQSGKLAFSKILGAADLLVAEGVEVSAVVETGGRVVAQLFGGELKKSGAAHSFYAVKPKGQASDQAVSINFVMADITEIKIISEINERGFYQVKSISFLLDPAREPEPVPVFPEPVYNLFLIDLD